MNVIEVLQMAGENILVYAGSFVLVLSILVFVHEWGHYIVARLCGVRVEVFSIGFGKELLGVYDKNGTRWKLSLVPLGGYVKLFGDVDPASAGHTETVDGAEGEAPRPMTPEERKTAFFAQALWKRACIVFAGPAINYIFAILLMAGLFTFHGRPVTPPSASAVVQGSAADKNGFLPHDKVLSIGGNSIQTFEDIKREVMVALNVKQHFVVERAGKTLDIYATPDLKVVEDRFGFKHSEGLLGLIDPRYAISIDTILTINGQSYKDEADVRAFLLAHMGETLRLSFKKIKKDNVKLEEKNGAGNISDQEEKDPEILIVQPLAAFNMDLKDPENKKLYLSDVKPDSVVKYPMFEALGVACNQTWVVTRGTLEALGQMVMGVRSTSELGGMIRIGTLAGDMAKLGIPALIYFMAMLSISLGLLNLFPIPMLDGGHLVFYALEAILRRPVPEQIQEYAFRIGMVFLIGVMVFANLSDVIQLLL